MQNYCHYDEFYGVFGSIIKGDLKEGKWYFFGDFDYQNLWANTISDKIKKRNPKLYLKDYIFDENILCYTKGEKSIKEEDFISAKVTACQYNNNTFSCFGYIMPFDDV